MNLSQAQELFNKYVKSSQIQLHCREVEAIMKALAIAFQEDPEKWAITGLLHDLDYEIAPELSSHAKKTVEILKEKTDILEEIQHAILSHNESTGTKRETRLDFALSAADNLSGIIYAYALMRKSLDGMEPSGLKKKLKDKKFAEAVRRDLIYDIEKAGMPLEKFLEISIKAVQSIKAELGF